MKFGNINTIIKLSSVILYAVLMTMMATMMPRCYCNAALFVRRRAMAFQHIPIVSAKRSRPYYQINDDNERQSNIILRAASSSVVSDSHNSNNSNSASSIMIIEEEEEEEEVSMILLENNDGDEIQISETSTTNNNNKLQSKDDDDIKSLRSKLKQELRQYRINQSSPLNKPAYTIFTNTALDEICNNLPINDEELLAIKGIGPKKLSMFGDDIIHIVQRYADDELLPTANGTTKQQQGKSSVAAIERPPPITMDTLTLQQQAAATLAIEQQQNVFISGAAGTGKSHLSKYIIQQLSGGSANDEEQQYDVDDSDNEDDSESKKQQRKCAPTAPTGVAAINIGGSTLHSFFGIGLGTGSISSLIKKVRRNKAAMKRIDETDVLLIDEVSMLSADLFETIDGVVREIRCGGKYSNDAMGGMQIVAVGDFFQLPPIIGREYQTPGMDVDEARPFCFDSYVWKELELDVNTIELSEARRQDSGSKFELFLNMVRVGTVTSSIVRDLNRKCLISEEHCIPNDGIVPTRIYTHNRDVDAENEMRLDELEGTLVTVASLDEWKEKMPTGTLASIKKNMKTSIAGELPDEVKLKVGAQVMLTRNKDMDSGDRSLVNGSRGVVTSFDMDQIPTVRFDNGRIEKIIRVEAIRDNPSGESGVLVRKQVPLKLAWATTVHKSQGSTLTRAILDISSCFEVGQVS